MFENAEQKIAALEAEIIRQGQVVAQLQNEFTSARADSARASTTASSAGGASSASGSTSASIDTRLLGKPTTFEGADEAWPPFQLILKAYCGALGQEYLDLMSSAEVTETVISMSDLNARQQLNVRQLYFILAMLMSLPSIP